MKKKKKIMKITKKSGLLKNFGSILGFYTKNKPRNHDHDPRISWITFGTKNLEMQGLLYHSTKIAKAGPGFEDRPEHPSIQINSSSP